MCSVSCLLLERAQRARATYMHVSRGYLAMNIKAMYTRHFFGLSSNSLRIAVGHRAPPNECSANRMAKKPRNVAADPKIGQQCVHVWLTKLSCF